jgi:integrase
MKCKSCKREIDDDSFFCTWCGKEVTRGRKKKEEVSVPKPKQLKSGEFYAQIMVGGLVEYVKADTEREYYAKARAVKSGLLKTQKTKAGATVGQLVDQYIAANTNVLSPSTIRSYLSYRTHRFQSSMQKDALSVDWQAAINAEAAEVSPKSVLNAWRLITASYRAAKLAVPDVNLPKVPKADRPWLDFEQIKIFLKAVEGEPCELGALLALHSLRRSEILNLEAANITTEVIKVRGAAVHNADGILVSKATNKNSTSTRDVPIMIPRILKLLPESGKVITGNPNNLWTQINRVCKKAGLPEVGVHGLRHSFASLAFHLNWPEMQTMTVGGWHDYNTVHNIYTHLASQDRTTAIENMTAFFADS